jgi:hypothetical protein
MSAIKIKYDRLYSDSDGRSCVAKDLEIELLTRDYVHPAPPIGVSELRRVSTLVFYLLQADFIGDWHPSPKRQWLFFLQGEMEYEAGDGTKWRVGPGSYMLTEDTTGQGHRSRVVSQNPTLIAAIQLE